MPEKDDILDEIDDGKDTVSKATSIKVLKTYLSHGWMSDSDIAKLANVSTSLVHTVVKDFVGMVSNSKNDGDFPKRVLDWYEGGLSTKEIADLQPVIFEKVKKAIRENPSVSPLSDQPQDKNNEVQDEHSGVRPYDISSHYSLLKELLLNNQRVPQKAAEGFMRTYSLMENQFMANPMMFRQALIANFGLAVAEHVFTAFASVRGSYVYDPATNQPVTNNPWAPYTPQQPQQQQQQGFTMGHMMGGMGMGGPGGGMGMPPMMANMPVSQEMQMWFMQKWFDMMREAEEDKRAERRQRYQAEQMSQYTSMMMNAMMQKMAESQTPTSPNAMMMTGLGFKEIIDPNTGKVVGRETVPVHHGGGDSTLAASMIKSLSEERNTLLSEIVKNRNQSQDLMSNPLFTMLINKLDVSANPFKMLGEIRNTVPELFEKKEPISLDALKLKFDTEMNLLKEKIELKKVEHEWHREDQEKILADKQMDRWFNGLSGLGSQIFGPAIQTVLTQAASRAMSGGGQVPQQQGQNPYAQQGQYQQPQPNPMAGYQQINPNVVTPQQQQMSDAEKLKRMSDDELDSLSKEADRYFSALEGESSAIRNEIRRRRAAQSGYGSYMQSSEAAAQPQVVGAMPPGSDPVPPGR